MDTDKDGKVSKQEWMTFMEAEFDRLDKAKNGQLDVKAIEIARKPLLKRREMTPTATYEATVPRLSLKPYIFGFAATPKGALV